MCCGLKCILKFVMGIVNALLMIIGLALLVIGALLLWGMEFFMKNIFDIKKYIDEFTSKFNVTIDSNSILSLIQTNSNTIGTIAFAAGCILVGLAILGIIVSCCCSVRNILIVVLVLVIIMCLAMIVCAAYYGTDYENKILNPLENTIREQFVNKYVSMTSKEPESVLLNVIQITVRCCGISQYLDYNNVTTFNRTTYDSNMKIVQLQFPESCCEYDETNRLTMTSEAREKCIKNGESKYKSVGCWSTHVKPALNKYLGYAFASAGITIGILVAVIIALIICIICADKVDA